MSHVTAIRNRARVPQAPAGRAGITLLEVLIALAIFLGAITVIGQIINTGSQAAIAAQQQAEAVRRCETVLAETLAGSIPMQDSSGSFEDDPDWSWSVTVLEGPHVDLLSLEVVVAHVDQFGKEDERFALVRWVRNPELFLETTVDSTEGLF
jgi:type II secretory pathway pseudopilin PulG